MIVGNWGVVLPAGEGIRVEGSMGDVRSGEITRKACSVAGPVTVSGMDSMRVGRVSFDALDGKDWSLLSKLYLSTTGREDSISRADEGELRWGSWEGSVLD